MSDLAGGGDRAEGVELLRSHLLYDLDGEEARRVERIADETLRAFRALEGVRRGVALFGSARGAPAAARGRQATETARRLAEAGFAVITGGGPGFMEAANEGARNAADAGTSFERSIGLTIELPGEEPVNPYLGLRVRFHYFFLRKLAFVKYTCAFVCFPGGYGTLDELFEALNLVRTHRLHPFPVLLYGSDYWAGLADWLQDAAVEEGCLGKADLELFEMVDDPATVVARVKECHRRLCGRLGIDT